MNFKHHLLGIEWGEMWTFLNQEPEQTNSISCVNHCFMHNWCSRNIQSNQEEKLRPHCYCLIWPWTSLCCIILFSSAYLLHYFISIWFHLEILPVCLSILLQCRILIHYFRTPFKERAAIKMTCWNLNHLTSAPSFAKEPTIVSLKLLIRNQHAAKQSIN